MGKEHDLLNASKTGNVSQIEKILGQRGKKSGLQSIISKSTNPNYQDEMGYTPLHYASLHGHRAAVELLLKYDASANIPDHSGNFPLHLAAFNGHADVCRVLINSGPSRAKVNEQNGTEDTAMHSAAQSKSSQVVAVLLENHADPFIRNCRKESPLDLAAQYGRIENVKLLLSYHPNLLQNNVKTHSPLHLAARNGHIDVVSNLLGCGMAVNFQCDTGTALHEAALFGKLDVCNFLLQCDVDITIKDKNHMTVMDLLMNHPTARTKEISALIYNYNQTSKMWLKSAKPTSRSCREQRISTIPNTSQRASTISYLSSSYDLVPDPGHRDTYDTVPPHHQHQPSTYDSVPPPQAAKTCAEDSVTSSEGYHFLNAPGKPSPLILTPQQVQQGYTALGVPGSGKTNANGEYSTVRPEGSLMSTSPTSSVIEQQRMLSGKRQDPLPSKDMVSKDNLAYYQIEPHTSHEPESPTQTTPARASNIPEYEYVPRNPTKRPLNIPEYEVPPAPIPQSSQSEGDYGLIGAINVKPSKPIRQSRKDTTEVATSPPVYEVPPSFKQREEPVSSPPRGPVCPLNVSESELERLGCTGSSPLGPDAAALASQPGYEFMDRKSPVQGTRYDYEVLAPAGQFEPREPAETPGQYQVVSFPARPLSEGPPKPSPAQSPSVYEIAPTPIVAPQECYPSGAPVYEIAPPPRPQIPARPAPYSVPKARPLSDNVSPPKDSIPSNRTSLHNVPLIEGMDDDKEPPLPPPRPANEYQHHRPIQSAGDLIRASNQPSMAAPYEKVRLEAPKGGKLNLEQGSSTALPPRTHLGDYCTIDPNAISPMNPPKRVSSGSSFGSMSEGSDVSDVPGVPPPSASVAEAVVFETLEREGKEKPKTTDKPVPAPREKHNLPSSTNRPIPLPRRESLNDRPKWHTDENELTQDPFSNPPNRENKINESNYEDNTNTVFTSLHKQFSPHSSREDLTDNSCEETNKSDKSTPLLYENILFKRSSSGRTTSKPQPSQVQPVGATKDDSVENEPASRLSSEFTNSLDEEAEWEKIDQLLLSFGDIENLGEQIADAGKATSVPEWLTALGVGQYETDLMNDGFDDLDFLNGGVLEDQDLLDIGVVDLSHRKIILEAVKSLPMPPRIAKLENPPTTVDDWLKLIKLSDYLPVFLHQGFTTMERVRQLWEVELTSVLEINCLGHRNRILSSLIEPRRMTLVRKSRQNEVDSKGDFGLDEKLAELKEFCPDEEPAKVVSSLDGETLDKIAENMINDEALKKKTLQRKRQNQWPHEPEVLLKGSVEYTTQYLGSQTVKEIVGIKSTVDACRKMKLSTVKLQKIPSVTLAVSVNGIQFIDSRTKMEVSHHQMKNVSYITQDPDDRRVFAYIAKDSKVNRHYCHVFRVEDVNLSAEITMTIGQAFELAYDQYLQIQSLMKSQS